ncbi:putative ribonuclease H protein [Hibiscus syriacus]|uniref:Ribonuclease H protein n=1 Tax=Hibiscus syriacus TaxID=106335 RepID=A0A6A2YQI0_HIBSY|nr:putative ribonuclease H protein [Hibiscus syriacus]
MAVAVQALNLQLRCFSNPKIRAKTRSWFPQRATLLNSQKKAHNFIVSFSTSQSPEADVKKESCVNLGLSFFKGRVKDALVQFETALSLDPNPVEAQAALYNKACCHAYRSWESSLRHMYVIVMCSLCFCYLFGYSHYILTKGWVQNTELEKKGFGISTKAASAALPSIGLLRLLRSLLGDVYGLYHACNCVFMLWCTCADFEKRAQSITDKSKLKAEIRFRADVVSPEEWERSVNSGSVYLGDDRCCNIVGIDEVRIKMYDGSVQTLSGVRHIPDLKKNLISLGTLHKNGFIPKADEDRETIRIVKGALTVMKGKITAWNIYKLLGSTVIGGVHSVESCDDTTKLWHMRLVHLSEREYTDSQFLHFCKEHGIKRHFTVRKTPQQNGVVERIHRSVNERARCLRLNAGLPKHFWAEAINMACYFINRSPRASLVGKVAEDVWTGHDVTFDHLRIFGCPAYVHVPADERSKLDAKLKECIFLGYMKGQKKDTTVVDFEQFPVEKTETSQPTSGGSTTDDLQDYITSQENDKWMASMVEETESLNHNRTWEHTSIRAVLALVASWDLPLEKMDVKTAFLHGDLEEQIYIRQPEGFTQPGNEHLVCRLKKSLYGLKQSPRQWYKRFDSYMIKIGYKRWTKTQAKLWLSQRGYVEKMLEMFAMSSAKPVSTQLANHFKLSSEQCPKIDKEAEDMAKVLYSNTVGCLMYAMVCTRPDLAHAVSQVCKYMSKLGKQHWDAVKWIFRYLKGTVGHQIVFNSQRDNPLIVGYVDSDYACDMDNRRSTTGYVFTLGGGIIFWKSTIQSVVALSTTEAEYMAAAEAAKEVLWLTGLVKELGVQQG